jgi:hypothetical protein
MRSILLLSLLLATSAAIGQSPAIGDTKPSAGASFQLRNKKYGQLLRPEEARSANGTRLVLYPAQPWKCMTWKFRSAGESAFQLQNHFTSKTFAAEPKTERAVQAVTQVPLGDQGGPSWQFTKLPDGTYRIADAKSGLVLTVAKDENGAARIVVKVWRDDDDQRWELISIDPKQLTM